MTKSLRCFPGGFTPAKPLFSKESVWMTFSWLQMWKLKHSKTLPVKVIDCSSVRHHCHGRIPGTCHLPFPASKQASHQGSKPSASKWLQTQGGIIRLKSNGASRTVPPIPILCIPTIQAFCTRIKESQWSTLQQRSVLRDLNLLRIPYTWTWKAWPMPNFLATTNHFNQESIIFCMFLCCKNFSAHLVTPKIWFQIAFLTPPADHCHPTWDPGSTWLVGKNSTVKWQIQLWKMWSNVDGSEIPNNHCLDVKIPTKNGINYQPQLLSRISSINSPSVRRIEWNTQGNVFFSLRVKGISCISCARCAMGSCGKEPRRCLGTQWSGWSQGKTRNPSWETLKMGSFEWINRLKTKHSSKQMLHAKIWRSFWT